MTFKISEKSLIIPLPLGIYKSIKINFNQLNAKFNERMLFSF